MGFTSLKAVTRRTATIVTVVVATTVVVSGTLSVAEAARQAVTESVANNSVNSAKIVDNSIQSVDIRNSAVTGADIATGTVRGSDLRDGTVGPADFADAVEPRWAHVEGGSTPAIIKGRNASSVVRQGTGIYRVTFDRALNDCAYVATLTNNGGGVSSPGQISAERGASPSEVWVRTYSTSGVPADTDDVDGFTVIVVC